MSPMDVTDQEGWASIIIGRGPHMRDVFSELIISSVQSPGRGGEVLLEKL